MTLTEAQRRAMHNGYSDYVKRCPLEAAEWELWQAACEWAWKHPRRSLVSMDPEAARTRGVQGDGLQQAAADLSAAIAALPEGLEGYLETLDEPLSRLRHALGVRGTPTNQEKKHG